MDEKDDAKSGPKRPEPLAVEDTKDAIDTQRGRSGEQEQPEPNAPLRPGRRRPDRRTWKGLSFNQKLQATFQGLIFFVTSVYAVIASLQWCTMRDQLAQSGRMAETSGRAWVVPIIDMGGIKLNAPAVPLTVTFTNYGNSPAFNLVSTTDWAFSANELPSRLVAAKGSTIIPPRKEPPQSVPVLIGGHIMPDGEMAPAILTEEQRAEIAEDRRHVYVGGLIRYDDPYGTGRETRWCTVYVRLGMDFVPCPPGVGTTYMR